jgi:siroheme synthase (precorrin-2 oxidase/ferrochelatase)
MPLREAAKPSSPWTLKTLKIAIETQSQSKYLTKRIRRHYSSSLELIIKALYYLSKGAKAVIHKVTLLVAENKEL